MAGASVELMNLAVAGGEVAVLQEWRTSTPTTKEQRQLDELAHLAAMVPADSADVILVRCSWRYRDSAQCYITTNEAQAQLQQLRVAEIAKVRRTVARHGAALQAC